MRRALLVALAIATAATGCTGSVVGQDYLGPADSNEAVANLGARLVRMEFEIGSSCSSMQPALEAYAASGARVLALAGFSGYIPTVSQAQSLSQWTTCFGPGSTWANAHTNFALDTIEFGNETSYGYQYDPPGNTGPWSCSGLGACYTARAQAYANRFMAARQALDFAGHSDVKLLAQADDAGTGSNAWVHGLKVGGLTSAAVGGWTVHPYGPDPASKLNRLLLQTGAEGYSSSIPVDATEVGIASAECSAGTGRTLSGDNHGWPLNLNYSTAASDLNSSLDTIRSTLGDRLGEAMIFGAKDGRTPCDGTAGTESYYGGLKSDLSDKGVFSAEVRDQLGQ